MIRFASGMKKLLNRRKSPKTSGKSAEETELLALERYERRVLSRRSRAIRRFDALAE